MGETDVTFRHLLRKLPRPLLRLAFPGRKLEPLGPIDPSVDRIRQLTTDNLFRVRDRTGEVVVHVEIEREWRAGLPLRLFDYATAGVSATHLPVWSIVILLRPGGHPPAGTGVYRIPGLDGDAFVFRYRVVPLWKFDARSMRAELGLEAAPFCVAMHGADAAFVRSLFNEVRRDSRMTKRARKTTAQLLYAVSAAIFGADTARRIFNVDWLMQDPNVQELIRYWQAVGRAEALAEGKAKGRAEGVAKGRAEGVARGRAEGVAKGVAKGRAEGVAKGRAEGVARGRARGRAEGVAKGRAEEARVALRRVLAARAFRLTPDARARIDREPRIARLEAWIEAAVNAESISDVFGSAVSGRSRRSPRRRPVSRRPAPQPRGRARRSR